MRYSYSGEAESYTVPLRVDNSLVVPDANSVYYTFRNGAGVPFPGRSDVAYTTTPTTTAVTINATAGENTKSASVAVEARRIDVRFKVNDLVYRNSFTYRVVDSSCALVTVEPSEVRALLGISTAELPDEDLDIIGTWLKFKTNAYETLLAAGGVEALLILEAVAYTEALRVLPSLRMRAAQSEGDSSIHFTRFAKMDWAELERALTDGLSSALATATNTPEVVPGMGVLSTRVDPITGV